MDINRKVKFLNVLLKINSKLISFRSLSFNNHRIFIKNNYN